MHQTCLLYTITALCITCTGQDIYGVKLRTAVVVVVVVVAVVIEIVTSVFIRIYFLPRSG